MEPVMELDGCPFKDGLASPGINAKWGHQLSSRCAIRSMASGSYAVSTEACLPRENMAEEEEVVQHETLYRRDFTT